MARPRKELATIARHLVVASVAGNDPALLDLPEEEIGRASCRERV